MAIDENLKKAACDYHHMGGVPGKISLKTTKPFETQQDLSLAYTPGVAAPCLEIQANPEDIWKYTAKGNLVAVVSDGRSAFHTFGNQLAGGRVHSALSSVAV